MIRIHTTQIPLKNAKITFCSLDLHLIECMQTFSGMIVAAPKLFLIPRSLDPSLISTLSALHCALHCFHIKCNVSKTQYTSQCRDLIAKGCKRTRKYYFAALSVQCFGAMPDQRWVSRYPDGTGWLDTSTLTQPHTGPDCTAQHTNPNHPRMRPLCIWPPITRASAPKKGNRISPKKSPTHLRKLFS